MYITLQQVLDFHKKMNQAIGDPRSIDLTVDQQLRIDLIDEEFTELKDALAENDPVKAADALGDLIYTVTGAAVTWGIDLASVTDEIHASNMTKKPENKRADGKVLKDADYKPPNIEAVLAEAKKVFDCSEDGWWEEPTQTVTDKIMASAKEQAKLLAGDVNVTIHKIEVASEDPDRFVFAMKDIKEDLVPGVVSNGHTIDNKTYTVNKKAFEELLSIQDEYPITASNGVPEPFKGEMTAYGAFVFDCTCGRRHAIQAKLGSRGGLASHGSCECICGKAYIVDFRSNNPKITQTSIEEMRKVNG